MISFSKLYDQYNEYTTVWTKQRNWRAKERFWKPYDCLKVGGLYMRLCCSSCLRLADSWSIIAVIPADRTTRVIGLLDSRCFEIRDFAHGHLLSIWNILIHFNKEEGSLTINQAHPGLPPFHIIQPSRLTYKRRANKP